MFRHILRQTPVVGRSDRNERNPPPAATLHCRRPSHPICTSRFTSNHQNPILGITGPLNSNQVPPMESHSSRGCSTAVAHANRRAAPPWKLMSGRAHRGQQDQEESSASHNQTGPTGQVHGAVITPITRESVQTDRDSNQWDGIHTGLS